jgi:hypothetical protein
MSYKNVSLGHYSCHCLNTCYWIVGQAPPSLDSGSIDPDSETIQDQDFF